MPRHKKKARELTDEEGAAPSMVACVPRSYSRPTDWLTRKFSN